MIARIWHGWTLPNNADPYQQLLQTKILPGIHRVAGYKGAHLLRRAHQDSIEFVTITFFESLDAVRVFAGADYEKAVISAEAHKLLARFDERSVHYEVVDGSV